MGVSNSQQSSKHKGQKTDRHKQQQNSLMSTAPIRYTGCAFDFVLVCAFDSYPPQQAIEAVVLA
jgi:hypothetical protein